MTNAIDGHSVTNLKLMSIYCTIHKTISHGVSPLRDGERAVIMVIIRKGFGSKQIYYNIFFSKKSNFYVHIPRKFSFSFYIISFKRTYIMKVVVLEIDLNYRVLLLVFNYFYFIMLFFL